MLMLEMEMIGAGCVKNATFERPSHAHSIGG